jgi:hypothetical protein
MGQVPRMHTVIDTYSSFAFGFLHVSKQPKAAVLPNKALPFYAEMGVKVENILTANSEELCGSKSHPYQLYMELNEIEYRTTKTSWPRTNRLVGRFDRTALDEFLQEAFRRQKLYESVEVLQHRRTWTSGLIYTTETGPQHGYRDMGRRSIERTDECLEDARKEG